VSLVERYLLLGLRLGRHIDGFVDSYYGPPGLSDQVDAEPLTAPGDLIADADALLSALDGTSLEENRRAWLRAQLTGLRTVAGKLAGEPVSYVDEVERCYGVPPRLEPDETFAAAHAKLDEVLPGPEPIAERYERWVARQAVPKDVLEQALRAIAVEARRRAVDLVSLPDDEDVEFEVVTDKPWRAFNYYLGGLRSRIAVNLDVPVAASELLHLVAHEAYPGHHTEQAWKERLLVRDRDQLEETGAFVGTPSNLVAEGIAEVGFELLCRDGGDESAARILADLGVPYDAAEAASVREARRPLQLVGANVAYLLHEQGVSTEEARDYALRWAGVSEARVELMMTFATDPTWRAYVTCYGEGLRLCRGFVDGDPAAFRRLLTEQVTVDELSSRA
jgi:hypothetical protein